MTEDQNDPTGLENLTPEQRAQYDQNQREAMKQHRAAVEGGHFDYDPDAMQQQINQRGYGVQEGQVVPGGVDRQAMHIDSDTGQLVNAEQRPRASMARLTASFENAQDVDEHEVRHGTKRRAAFQALFEGLHLREQPHGKVEYIGLDKAHALMEEYKQARDEGYTDAQLEIVPLSAYYAKLFPADKPPIRSLMAGEWGVIQKGTFSGTILILSDSDLGSAPMVTVPAAPAPEPGQILTPQGVPHAGLKPGPGEEE